MAKIADLLGTISSFFRLGLSGVLLKSSLGSLVVRNSGDTANAPITVSTVNLSGDSLVVNSDATGTGSDRSLTIQRSAEQSSDLTFSLPANAGSAGQVLATDGSGNLRFVSVAFDYIQNGVPPNPQNNDRWLELDANGLPVEGWFYDATNTLWLSINKYCGSNFVSNVGATTTTRVPTDAPGHFSGLLLTRVEMVIGTGTSHNSTNFYTIAWQIFVGTSAALAIGGINNQNTRTLVGSTPSLYFQDANVALTDTILGFAFTLTRSGTPANVWALASFTTRKIR